MKMKTFQDIPVWQKAPAQAPAVYQNTALFPKDELEEAGCRFVPAKDLKYPPAGRRADLTKDAEDLGKMLNGFCHALCSKEAL
ncbi:MAG: hypothetical protein BWY42_00559 [Candidatus Omnitrophica bacterium ADurb.Bin277]|nr:MAG: hypothetical protein BWY42_00559 [Candidatus Omnitrophica bacterium ADurb.Bin277]